MMSRLDDDDSVGSCSVGSEESFYVGIERADYSSPDNFEMYGAESKDFVEKEDRLGIGRVTVKVWEEKSDVVVHEKSSSLYSFMAGGQKEANASVSKKDVMVAMPLVVDAINYKQGTSNVQEDHSQVYQQEAAEGKMFINKLVEGKSSAEDESVADMMNQPTITPAKRNINTPFTTPASVQTKRGHYPVISPTALFSPFVQAPAGEDNVTRQLREREIRKDAEAEAKKHYDEQLDKLQKDFRIFLLRSCTSENGFPVSELKKQMDAFMKSNSV